MGPRDTTRPPSAADDTEPCPALTDADEEGFQIGYPIRPVTFLPTFDLSAEELDEP